MRGSKQSGEARLAGACAAAAVLLATSALLAAPARDDAYRALERGDFDGAAALARAIVDDDPRDGEALYVLGLAELAAGRSAAALTALDRASQSRAPVSRANLALHRGHALQALARLDEADQAYARAAALDPALAPIARQQQARIQSERSRGQQRAVAPAPADHDRAAEAFLRGGSAYRAGRLAEAAAEFQLAAGLDPEDGESLMMEGITRVRLGQPRAGQRRLQRALRLGLSGDDRALAEQYLALVPSDRPPPSPWSGYLMASAGGGVDSNVTLEALGGNEAMALGAQLGSGSPFATVSLITGVDWRRGSVTSGLGLTFLQLAYLEERWDALSFQSTTLDWGNRLRLGDALRLSLTARGELAASGLTTYAPFQAAAGLDGRVSLREAEWAESHLTGSVTAKSALDPEYAHAGGRRLEVTLAQDLRLADWVLVGTFRLRRDDLGAVREAAGEVVNATPYSYGAGSAGLRLASPSEALVRVGLGARFEDRFYDPSYTEARASSGASRRSAYGTRRDNRWAAGLDVHVGRAIGVVVRYELLVNRSRVGTVGACSEATVPCPPVVPGARSYVKHVVTLEAEGAWF